MTHHEIDHSMAIQQAAERHIKACWDALDDEEDSDPDGPEVSSPAVGPFCGCTTCEVREVLAGAWPAIERYFASRDAEQPPSSAPGGCSCQQS